jgi:hypothetical protein
VDHEPINDIEVQNLKKTAEAGGEHGPLYDQGVLTVINSIEKHGGFIPSRWVGAATLFKLGKDDGQSMLSHEEMVAMNGLFQHNKWSPEDAVFYAEGIGAAEKLLPQFKVAENHALFQDRNAICCTPCPVAGCGGICVALKHEDNAHLCTNSHAWQGPSWGS